MLVYTHRKPGFLGGSRKPSSTLLKVMTKNVNKVSRKTSKLCKRGKRKSVKYVEKHVVFVGLNPDGAMSKITTIKKTIRETASSVWMMQETKVSQPGNIKFDVFVTYEHTRNNKDGGGLSISALETLKPVFVRDGGEEVEALTVIIHSGKITISCNTAYGPQENAELEKKEKFWAYLEEEYKRASKEGNGFVLQGDLNSWLGPEIIPGDNRKMNQNGKMLVSFVRRNKLTIVNSLPICEGTTTWTRTQLGVKHVSTINFFIVCEQVLPFVKKMKIDSEGFHKITNFKSKENSTEADPMIMSHGYWVYLYVLWCFNLC